VNIKGGVCSSAFFMGCLGIEAQRDFGPINVLPTSHIRSRHLLRLRMKRALPYSGYRIKGQKIPSVNQNLFFLTHCFIDY
jgi:hypothetical protein